MLYTYIKRLVDVLASAILIILFLPVWIVIPILIKLDSPGPILYTPKRVGKNGQPFGMYKFRSMRMFKLDGKVVHAVDYFKKDKKLYEKYRKLDWKLPLNEDPRITKLGRILRQTSIDEFPQVFNILKGDMSLVGFRAYVKSELEDSINRHGEKYQKYIDQALTAKPGLTGPWQVSGRNDVPWTERIKLDARYALKNSLLVDLQIILRTPLAMISKW